jgi:hypothetical protein
MRLIVISLFTLGVIVPAYADAVFTLGNKPQPNEQRVLFNEPNEMGTTIDGLTNISDTMVQFSSTQALIGSGGQDDIDAQSGNINNLMITVPGHTFSDLIFNLSKPTANGDLDVMVVTNTGSFPFTYGSKNGENFLTITTTGGEVIDSVTIDSASGSSFQGLKQPRISISGVVVVPEPSSILLFGSGLALLFLIIQKKGRRLGFKT